MFLSNFLSIFLSNFLSTLLSILLSILLLSFYLNNSLYIRETLKCLLWVFYKSRVNNIEIDRQTACLIVPYLSQKTAVQGKSCDSLGLSPEFNIAIAILKNGKLDGNIIILYFGGTKISSPAVFNSVLVRGQKKFHVKAFKDLRFVSN